MFRKIPLYIQYIFINTLIFWLLSISFRFIFYFYNIDNFSVNIQKLSQSIGLGIRFDLKLAVLINLPLLLFLLITNDHFFQKKIYKKIIQIYWIFIYTVFILFYLFDLGYYDYLTTRIDASSLRFLSNIVISTQVLWESYPVVKGLLIVLIFVCIFTFISSKLYYFFARKKTFTPYLEKIIFGIITFIIFAFGIYNSTTHYPLRWSQAFFSKDNRINQFTLNPILYFFDSFTFRSESFDIEKTKKYYPFIAKYLNLPKDSILYFQREKIFIPFQNKPNVVVVMLESLGAAAMGSYKNPMNATPKIDSIVKNSVHFTNFYVHKAGTAASVFASITGLPDIDDVETASRNPMVINQKILMDQLDDYKKLYFLGGSANWANIRGLLQSNIKDLKIFEEGSYKNEKRSDVWGIDDYELFKEADKELEKLHKRNKPFTAYIQTSSNHIPFTVPDKKGSYKPLKKNEISMEVFKKSGFKSLEQINALRYLDFNVNSFLRRAQKSGYYDNTIFLFFGDHNTAMNTFDFMQKKQYQLGLSVHHVPFWIHAPKFVKPQIKNHLAKLIDLYPTALSLAKINYINYTLGMDLLDTLNVQKHFAFLYKKIDGEPAISVLKDSFCYSKTNTTKKIKLYKLNAQSIKDVKEQYPKITKQMDNLLQGFYHSTKYLYFNNKK